ncbi:RNA polymerase sigma factor SigJ [Inquilinus sp.]|uniref:RNA polymerase sigma factor SigJ n=1 Tax=Inquilinus sp. TaxID=1932117 RepID=UPI0031D4E05C
MDQAHARTDAADFEASRRVLWGLAYRMLGSRADAEDAVQETWLRWQAADRSGIDNARAWLVTACTRLCIDQLRSARHRRETYVGPWLPEPLVTDTAPSAADELERAETLTTAFLLLLEKLTPVERAAYLLQHVFGLDHAAVATALDRTDVATRQLVSRARRKLEGSGLTAEPVPQPQHRAMVTAFRDALRSGDLAQLTALLARDARLYSDGGGKVRAAMNVIEGADKVARFFEGVWRKFAPDFIYLPRWINGQPGWLVMNGDDLIGTIDFAVGPDGITGVFWTRNPDKLGSVPLPERGSA